MSTGTAVEARHQRPRLELSGPRLARALETLVERSDEDGGVERYVAALQLKTAAFRRVLRDSGRLNPDGLRALLAHLPTVRRRVGAWLAEPRCGGLLAATERLLDGMEDTSSADARVARFCAAFPEDRAHRWVRDLAAELLHNVDPERYPLMCRWVWDARTNTGVLREIWHGEDVDGRRIEVPDSYETFVVLREELSGFLSANGVFRDVLQYVDLLTAQVYAGYICEQGGSYLRADFTAPEDPMLHSRRLLGLDGAGARGRSRLKVENPAAQRDDQPCPYTSTR